MSRTAATLLAVLLCVAPAEMCRGAVTQSLIVADQAQQDGRRYVREQFTDHVGGVQEVIYLAESGANINAILAGRVPLIEAQLTEWELAANVARIGTGLSPTFNHCTDNQFQDRVRELYRTATGMEAAKLGWYIDSLGLNNGELISLFGITGGELAALQAKLSNQASLYTDINAETGQ